MTGKEFFPLKPEKQNIFCRDFFSRHVTLRRWSNAGGSQSFDRMWRSDLQVTVGIGGGIFSPPGWSLADFFMISDYSIVVQVYVL